jgi:hypothetical protein
MLAVRAAVFSSADNQKYLGMSRTESGRFLDYLVEHKLVGRVLESYLPKQEIRHYIKDAILNRYSKEKRRGAKPENSQDIIKQELGIEAVFSERKGDVELYRSKERFKATYVIAVGGTYLKWETALKKALLFIAAAPFRQNAARTEVLLFLDIQGRVVPPADRKLLRDALSPCKAVPVFVGS